MDRDEAAALFARRRDAWLAEDVDGYLSLFADDLVLETPMGPPVVGLAAYEEMVRRSYAAVRPVGFEFHRIATDGSAVLAEWTITIAFRATGALVSYRGMSSCEIEDGRIRRWREYYDSAELAAAARRRKGGSVGGGC